MIMGEPLEVPQQTDHHHHHHHQQQTTQSLIPPATTTEDCWDSGSSSNNSSSTNNNNNTSGINTRSVTASLLAAQANSSPSSNSTAASSAKGPRRTRHRVDAGEPRGCFNSTNNPSFNFQPRNIFTSPGRSLTLSSSSLSVSGGRATSPIAHRTNSTNSNSPYHHHLQHQLQVQHHQSPYPPHHHIHNNLPGFSSPQQQQQQAHLGSLQLSPFHPHPPPGSTLYGGSVLPTSSSGGGQDAYYFQPMKMLSEFITSQQAAAAVAAAATAAAATSSSGAISNGQSDSQGPTPPAQLLLREMLSKSNRSSNNGGSKSRTNNNNNNNVTKCGYEEEVVMMSSVDGHHHKLSESSGEKKCKTEVGGGIDEDEDGNGEVDDDEISPGGDNDENTGEQGEFKSVKVETVTGENSSGGGGSGSLTSGKSNGHLNQIGQSQSVGGGGSSISSNASSSGKTNTTAPASGMRINGCKKRKLYQPQQRSDFDEAEEEELDDDDYDSNVLEAAMARSRTSLHKESPPSLSDPPPTELLHDEEEDDEEEMRMMQEKEDFDENFDADADDDEEMIDDELLNSNRTTPLNHLHPTGVNMVTRAQSNHPVPPTTAAPLTRQLLTERSSNDQKSNSLSLLRTTSSPKIILNSNNVNRENILRRSNRDHLLPHPQEINHLFDQIAIPFGANPAAVFYQWKENFKSTLITHINELVDTQFSILFPGGQQSHVNSNSGPGANNNNNNNNNSILREGHQGRGDSSNNNNRVTTPSSLLTPLGHHHQQQQGQGQQRESSHHHGKNSPRPGRESVERPPTQKNPSSLLLNGGIVSNNNNNITNNNIREKLSPPAEKIPKLELRGNKNDFHGGAFPRFPFQVHPGSVGNAPALPTPRDQNNGHGNKGLPLHQQQQQNFSSALMGLSHAAQLQHQAAAAAAALGAEMFDDGPLSLVVTRGQETPRKKRHKVTDTRLTPRAVSRLLGQVDNYGEHMSSGGSPSRGGLDGRGVTPPPNNGPASGGSTGGQANLPPSLPTSVAIPNPSLSDSRLFTPYAPLFHHHHPGGHPGHHRLDSPPMGASLLHPALLANPAEYVQQLRAEMNREEHQRNGGRGGEGDLRESRDHIRAVRDSGSLSLGGGGGPGSAGSDSGETNSYGDLPGSLYSCGASHSSSTLTPMHLRKAKLMFFWVRYPSSSVIKMYFPDIKFNKNNTAQLVKWFSNFREFYYIQMEKYARQALSEGIKNAEELHVTVDNELYRVLNLHYNRNNHIEVPSNFRYVVEQTLREFFKAIQQGKDQEQSWKKAIYKIIARLDDPVPEYFKSPNFLEQLE